MGYRNSLNSESTAMHYLWKAVCSSGVNVSNGFDMNIFLLALPIFLFYSHSSKESLVDCLEKLSDVLVGKGWSFFDYVDGF